MGRPERVLRFALLALLWGLWLGARAAWVLLEWLFSAEGRRRTGNGVLVGLLVAGIALLPTAGGLLWGRMMLQDAVEITAMQSEGRDPRDMEAALRRRAFELGFTDIVAQEAAVRVDRQVGPEGATCTIEMVFYQRLILFGWTAPLLWIHLKAERPALPQPSNRSLEELLS